MSLSSAPIKFFSRANSFGCYKFVNRPFRITRRHWFTSFNLFSICNFLTLISSLSLHASTNLHTTWLWHLHQPIYWPDRKASGSDHYEAAWDTIQQQDLGRSHPNPEVLRNIFGLDDRVNA